ncbi:hypothetical protein GGI03_000566 [Coemansia sp. RSA 2337]|nr:hypothetical protein GGI03_000566 [Coemansia sp. RSA 2337]
MSRAQRAINLEVFRLPLQRLGLRKKSNKDSTEGHVAELTKFPQNVQDLINSLLSVVITGTMLYSQLGYYVLTAITFPYLFSGLRWGLEYTAGREDKWESDERWFNHFKDLDTIIEGIKSIKIFAWEQMFLNRNPKPASNRDLVAIVGKTGAGKSSLLLAMCSEVEMTQGTGRLVGKIAYLEQQPWIMNDTLRANVLFGREYDEDYYWKVLSTCALIDDLEMWPNSDLTVIGENGMNISGGQRARLALARTVYSKADIYFLDDPLSAVDAIVKRHILDNIILSTGLLGDKLRFVTSNADTDIRQPHGLDRSIQDCFGKLTSGQKQMFGLCRVIMRKRKIVVLDEATANVDLETDKSIQALIFNEFSDCTVLTIAHRLETIMNSDRIIVMDKGTIAEIGTPQELLAKDGMFAQLVKSSEFGQ